MDKLLKPALTMGVPSSDSESGDGKLKPGVNRENERGSLTEFMCFRDREHALTRVCLSLSVSLSLCVFCALLLMTLLVVRVA